jgi:hypothetical protein
MPLSKISANGVTSTVVTPNTSSSFTATQTFSGTSSSGAIKVLNIGELASINTSFAPSTTTNFYVNNGAVQYYTTNNGTNFTLNFAFSTSTTLNAAMAVNDSLSLTLIVTNSSTAYYPSAINIDGNSITPKWQTGIAPTSGNVSATDTYNFVIIKTAATPTYLVLASQTKFA